MTQPGGILGLQGWLASAFHDIKIKLTLALFLSCIYIWYNLLCLSVSLLSIYPHEYCKPAFICPPVLLSPSAVHPYPYHVTNVLTSFRSWREHFQVHTQTHTQLHDNLSSLKPNRPILSLQAFCNPLSFTRSSFKISEVAKWRWECGGIL